MTMNANSVVSGVLPLVNRRKNMFFLKETELGQGRLTGVISPEQYVKATEDYSGIIAVLYPARDFEYLRCDSVE